MEKVSSRKVRILNIHIDNVSSLRLLKDIKKGGLLITPNVDHLVKLQKDREFYQVYNEAEYIVCDSKILFWTSGFLGNQIKEKISGSDFFPMFYEHYKSDENIKIFLLGGAKGVAEKARKEINKKVGREIIIETCSPSFGFEKNQTECREIIKQINNSEATVLAMGLGSPKQEKWIIKYRSQLSKVKIFLAVGATIDFEAGRIKRCPKCISNLGFEWFYRLLLEPKRLWKRYLWDSLPFFWLILKQKLNFYQYQKPIGINLQNAGLLSSQQVNRILREQRENPHKRFGDFVVAKGWLKAETINFFINEFPKLARNKRKLPLGQYLKAAKLISDRQIETILEQQKQTNLLFGEIAVDRGWVKPSTINFCLETLTTKSSRKFTEPFIRFKRLRHLIQFNKPRLRRSIVTMRRPNIVMLGPSTKEKGGMGAVADLILNRISTEIDIEHLSTWDGETSTLKLFLQASTSFIQKLLTGKVDVVHIHFAERGSTVRKAILVLLAFAFSKPVLMHAHGPEYHIFHAKLPKIVRRLLNKMLQNCTYLIVLSESWKSFYVSKCGIKPEKIAVMPNPVDLPRDIPKRINSEKITVLFLSKVTKRKGVYDLLQAIAQLDTQAKQKMRLILAGSGELEQIKSLAKELKIDDIIEFPGWISGQQKEELMAKADLFLLPSYNEGLPMALLEAMSWGLPVITTPVGGIPEFVIDYETGLLIEPGDIEKLTLAMESLINDKFLRLRLGKAARNKVAALDIEKYNNLLLDLYCSTLSKGRNLDLILPAYYK